MSDARQCQGITRRGEQCKRLAKAGSNFCGLPGHGDDRASTAGAPVGNANARKHGFYAILYTKAELDDVALAVAAGDLADEIALLRVRIRRAGEQGVDLNTISRALGRLTQMMKAQRVLTGEAADQFEEAMAEALQGLTEELGLGVR